MNAQGFAAFCFLAIFNVLPAASALTLEDIRTRLAAAGYSHIREVPSGKIKTSKATRDGKERSILVDSTGHFQELQ
ncbi:hypothetical protein ACVIHD_002384 [Bradyrhizobium embrapense]